MLSSYKKNKGYHFTYSLSDFYNSYTKEIKEPVSRELYMKITSDFFNKLRDEIVINRYTFIIPNGMGNIKIRKHKNSSDLKKHKIDYKKTKELKKTVYFLNIDSNRNYFKWSWIKKTDKIHRNLRLYNFKPTRSARLFLAHHIKKCNTDPNLRDYDCLN